MESLAKKYGVRIIGDKARTGTSTGLKVEGRTGLLDFRLETWKSGTPLFWCLPDSALTFANGAYAIKGVIGFPVMYAFKEFTIQNDRLLLVPRNHEETFDRNLALDGQYLIVRVTAKNDTLPFLFDSGNTTTSLSSLFFNSFKNEIVEKCKQEKETTGGAGGMVETEAYVLDSLAMAAGTSQLTLHGMKFIHGICWVTTSNSYSETSAGLHQQVLRNENQFCFHEHPVFGS